MTFGFVAPDIVIQYTEDISERKQAEADREKLIRELQTALTEVRTLSGLLPICANLQEDPGRPRILAAVGGLHPKTFRSPIHPRHLPGMRQKALSGFKLGHLGPAALLFLPLPDNYE